MGWGDAGVIQAKADDSYRMRVDLLPHTVKEAQSRGVRVIGIIGSTGSTATGSFDPLDEIADFCEAENLWFRVDAAHAGGFVFSGGLVCSGSGAESSHGSQNSACLN